MQTFAVRAAFHYVCNELARQIVAGHHLLALVLTREHQRATDMDFQETPHRRFNLLTGEWVLVSPHRTKRPWQGQQDTPDTTTLSQYEPSCYLCPGNERAGGAVDPEYEGVFVFTNDFASLLPPQQDDVAPDSPVSELLKAEPATGECRVICYSPRHDLTMARLPKAQVEQVVDVWSREYQELGRKSHINYVQIFENRGGMMGCSNPHPHGQIWASSFIPDIPAREQEQLSSYAAARSSCMLCDYLELELARQERIVFANDSVVALVPYWAVWPFEVLLLPRRHSTSLAALTSAERADLADALIRMSTRYDNLFQTSFPYSMGIHQQPTDGHEHSQWHWHIHYYPPLLRSQSVRKFMVGYEMMALPQRDITAEQAAAGLREQSEVHYRTEKDSIK